jgi:hypothetical protein
MVSYENDIEQPARHVVRRASEQPDWTIEPGSTVDHELAVVISRRS